MQHGLDGLAGEQIAQQPGIADIALHQRHLPAGQPLDPGQRLGRAVRKVIEHYDLMPGLKAAEQHMRADVAGAAGQKDGHAVLSSCVEAVVVVNQTPR